MYEEQDLMFKIRKKVLFVFITKKEFTLKYFGIIMAGTFQAYLTQIKNVLT